MQTFRRRTMTTTIKQLALIRYVSVGFLYRNREEKMGQKEMSQLIVKAHRFTRQGELFLAMKCIVAVMDELRKRQHEIIMHKEVLNERVEGATT